MISQNELNQLMKKLKFKTRGTGGNFNPWHKKTSKYDILISEKIDSLPFSVEVYEKDIDLEGKMITSHELEISETNVNTLEKLLTKYINN